MTKTKGSSFLTCAAIIFSILLIPIANFIPVNALTTDNTVPNSTNTVVSTTLTTTNSSQIISPIVNATGSTNVTDTGGSVSIGNPLGLPLQNLTIPVSASSSVAGVQAFGNGTIVTSQNGVLMTFFFDPQGPAGNNQGKVKPSDPTIIVKSDDLSGNQFSGMFMELQNPDGSDIATGYSPASFSTQSGKQYLVYANGYQNYVFKHWDDGSTNPSRAITPTQSMTLTAFYSGSTAAPQPPTGLTASAFSSSRIDLSWTAPTNYGSSAITGYTIERSTDGGASWSTLASNTGSTATTYSDTGLVSSTTYAYKVYAINSAGTSLPSNIASATTKSSSGSITKIQSGLVASDSLTNETKTQQQLQASNGNGYWFYGGDAPAENANYSFFRDSGGFHIGMQAPKDGTWAGFYGVSPKHNAKLFNAQITNPVRATQGQFYENGMYVQTANGNVSYVTCTTFTNNQATDWGIINATGNTNQVTSYEVLWFDTSANQPLSRNCSIVTNGNDFLAVYLDGSKVYEKDNANLQMPAPFNAFLEPQSSDGKEFLVGAFKNYYVTTDQNIKVTNLPSNAATVTISNSTGSVLASGTVSSGNATLNVGQFAFPLAATIKVFDSGNNLIASGPQSIYGGDVYSVNSSGGTTTGATSSGIALNNVQSTSGTVSASNQITLSNFNAGTGNNNILVVGVSANNNNAASVTFNGVQLTQAVLSFSNNDAELWYLKNPTGTGNGVDQTSPILTTTTNHNTTPSSPSISITTKSSNSLVLDLPSIYGGSTLGSSTCAQQWDVNIQNAITGASSSVKTSSPAAVTCKWTASSSDLWDDVAVELKAAS